MSIEYALKEYMQEKKGIQWNLSERVVRKHIETQVNIVNHGNARRLERRLTRFA